MLGLSFKWPQVLSSYTLLGCATTRADHTIALDWSQLVFSARNLHLWVVATSQTGTFFCVEIIVLAFECSWSIPMVKKRRPFLMNSSLHCRVTKFSVPNLASLKKAFLASLNFEIFEINLVGPSVP